jgi:hypothetical protein
MLLQVLEISAAVVMARTPSVIAGNFAGERKDSGSCTNHAKQNFNWGQILNLQRSKRSDSDINRGQIKDLPPFHGRGWSTLRQRPSTGSALDQRRPVTASS